ncbi:hypothetical protein C8035_v008898 [Colletotrichum spinosum]|nr:hypothetical protein C8035_v008898 [Colletotrichum spinosum]
MMPFADYVSVRLIQSTVFQHRFPRCLVRYHDSSSYRISAKHESRNRGSAISPARSEGSLLR